METKLKRGFYYFTLGLLGFATACGGNDRVEYGTPYINAKMSGKVTDKNNNPIEGIKVQSGYSQSTFTTADGRYEVSSERTGYYTQYLLLFTDIDGAENGGEFAEQRVKVEFTEADRIGEGSGAWFVGSFERADVNVEMEEVGVGE